MAHRDGGKHRAKHGTLTPTAAAVADAAVRLPEVERITAGVIKQARGCGRLIKFVSIPVGWQIKVKGDRAVQLLFVHTKSRRSTKKALEDYFVHEMCNV